MANLPLLRPGRLLPEPGWVSSPTGFNPLALPGLLVGFTAGVSGFYQDAARAVPATASGDLVRLAAAGADLLAPSDDARPQYLTGGAPHLSADGANDTLRADVALNGTLTVWMAGDFSLLGGDRFLSFGGDLGADWNRAGYIAFEDDAGGYLKMVRDNVAAQITSGYPPYILLEIDAAGHRSYGPLGVNSALAAPATNAARVGLYAAANSTPSGNGAMQNTSFGVVQGALDAATRSNMLGYLADLPTPV